MKICYLSGGRDVPSVRFRLAFFDELRQRGHDCTVLHNRPGRYDHYPAIGWRASQMLRRWIQNAYRIHIRFERYDVVVLETGIFHTHDDSLERRLRMVCPRFIFEIDDAVFLLFPEKCESLAKLADRIIAGNQAIADWAAEFNPNVTIVPTCVDLQQYKQKDYGKNENELPVIGWVGSAGNVAMIAIIASELRKLAHVVDFQLRIITSVKADLSSIDLTGVNVDRLDIDQCDVVKELHRCDIGIMPLPGDEPWMKYKCNAKMIQYMAVGLPAVGSSVGFNHELIDHGVNGMLAGDNQWAECLAKLIREPELRRELGEKGRQTVEQRFTVQSQIENYEKALSGSTS